MIKNIIAHMISIYNDSFWDRIAARFHKKERNNSMLSLLFMTLWVATSVDILLDSTRSTEILS